MSAEEIKNSTESTSQTTRELEAIAKEQLAQVRETAAERDPQDHADKRAEAAREVINRKEPEPAPKAETEAAPAGRIPALLNHHLNYTQTMANVQRRLTPVSRTFSKVIHAPLVEITSEALEKSVARPSVMLGTIWTALIVGIIFYLTAHTFGYALSGSELLFSFIVGGLLGIVGEGIIRSLRRR
jgi:chromatin segregation and condensation protein Rec8/ScpA/Scc1 (kleisin family)